MSVYCISGYPGAGKSEVARIAEENGATVISMGDQIRERMPDENNYNHTGEFATEQRNKHGAEIVAKWTERKIQNLNTDSIVIEGVRSIDELEYFKSNIDDFNLVVVTADDEIRLERLQERGRENEESFNMGDLKERDEREESWGLEELLQTSDYIEIENNSTLTELESTVNQKLNF
jgi:dephospho-CoA kinase